MRVIKFRGKRIDNGEWAYGHYAQVDTAHHTIFWFKEDGAPWWADVNPETVGQFTGLLDKEGKEIYEGDVLKGTTNKWVMEDKPEPHDFVGYVRWESQCDVGLEWVLTTMDSTASDPLNVYVHCVAIDYSTGAIIGNIHDNPELLKND